MNRHVLSILCDNNAGVLSRIAGLFTRRGYNISSLSVGVTQDENISRITIVVFCDDMDIEQIIKQVDKLVGVIRVIELDNQKGVFRELALIKVTAPPEKRSEIINIVDIFRANIVDVGTEALTVEITGEQSKIEAFTKLIQDFGIKEIVRTGTTGLCRGNDPIKSTRDWA